MNLRTVSLCLAAAALVTGCDRFERMVGLATPTPTPTPVPASAPATPKTGSWMWDKQRHTPLDTPPGKKR